jgi:hypothetical protein
MSTYYTFFSEYRRGQLPDDWTERLSTGAATRIEGAFCDLPHRNVLRLEGSGTRSILTWDVLDTDTSLATQEILCRFRWVTLGSTRGVLVVRSSGAIGSENGYRLILNMTGSPQVTLDKVVSDVSTTLGTATKTEVKLGTWLYLRLQATSTTIRTRVWATGNTEPGSWDVSVTDASLATGQPGFRWVSASEIAEVAFVSVATGGSDLISESDALVLTPPMDVWIANHADEVDTTARFEYYNPNTSLVETKWCSTYPRITSATDYPAGVTMERLLLDGGGLATRLESDAALSGAALSSLSPMRLDNRPVEPRGIGPLDAWTGYSFYGRPIEIRIGRRWQTRPSQTSHGNGVLTPHRRFEIIGCGIAGAEPIVSPDEVRVSLTSPAGLLSARVPAYRNIGIPTGFKSVTTSGWLSIPSSTSYNRIDYVVSLRALIPSAGVVGSGFSTLSRRQIDATHRQWHIAIYQASNALSGAIHFLCDDASGANLVSLVTTTRYNLGRFVDIIFAVKGTDSWYAYVDGMRVGSGFLSANPTLGTAAVVEVNNAPGVTVCDHRITMYAPEDESLSRFSGRRDPDVLTVSMHRCDDNTASTVTDYATLANHGTLQGTDPTDRIWSPTYLGSAELVGTYMPISGGIVFNGPAQPIDPVREAFRYNDRAKTTGTSLAVRAKGALLTVTTNYTEPSGGDGVIDIVGASDQPVTFTLAASGTPDDARVHVPRLVADELSSRGALTNASYNRESFIALRKQLPFRGGFYYPEPPETQTFLADLIGQLGGYYGLDQGRLYAGCMVPPVNPGPYGNEPLLELLGAPDRGVILAPSTDYDLTNTSNSWSLDCWFKFNTKPIDATTSSTFTHFPTGYTLIDRYDTATGSGYYLGFDGRTGALVFGTPGLTTSGRHYISLTFNFQPNVWYWAHGDISSTTRFLGVGIDFGFGGELAETVTGTWVPPVAGTPLRIGHGPAGSFPGSIAYAIGGSPKTSQAGPFLTKPTTSNRGGTQRFHLPLTDGSGDLAIERIQSRYALIDSCRWAYKTILDLRSSATATLAENLRPRPAWRVDARYRRNYQRLDGANIVAGVSAADRIALGTEYLSEVDQSDMVRTTNLNSKDVTLAPLVSLQADADVIGRLVRGRLSDDRLFSDVKNWYRDILRLVLTDEVLVYHDRFGLDEGRAMRVAHLVSRLASLNGDIGLWG